MPSVDVERDLPLRLGKIPRESNPRFQSSISSWRSSSRSRVSALTRSMARASKGSSNVRSSRVRLGGVVALNWMEVRPRNSPARRVSGVPHAGRTITRRRIPICGQNEARSRCGDEFSARRKPARRLADVAGEKRGVVVRDSARAFGKRGVVPDVRDGGEVLGRRASMVPHRVFPSQIRALWTFANARIELDMDCALFDALNRAFRAAAES